MTIVQRVSLLWRRFSPLEERLIAAVRAVLPPRAQAIFDAQIAGITLVQRSPPAWNEISFYRRRGGKVDWSDIQSFPRTGEFPVAEVRFNAAGRGYKATLTGIHGHIFDFSITPGPKAIAFLPWDGGPTARMLVDPLVADAARVPGPVPAEWLEFLSRRQQPPDGWKFYDAATAYRITLEAGEFLILAERDGDEFLLHPIEPPAAGFFYVPSHDASPEPIKGALQDVFAPP